MIKSSREIMKSRPPETGTPVLVRIQAAPLTQLDEWRRAQVDLPSRAEAIRRLTAAMLQILAKDPGEKSGRTKKR
jgi:hypothetical protein